MISEMKRSMQNRTVEWVFSSGKEYADPFNEVELGAVFIDPDGEESFVPAFWAGGNFWGIRYASHKLGKHCFRTVCSDTSNPDLHGLEGILEVIPYMGENTLLQHGPLRVSRDKRYLEHIDGEPFFWLGEAWWMGLVKRLPWPEGFKTLTADRVEKGFSVIQIVAGLYPDMAPFDPRGVNEAGFPWEKDYSRINPAYFDMADRRIHWLVQNGLVPCIVGSWGYFIEFAGEETMKKHWRNLVARYGAYPVVWCLAGEVLMPYYLFPVRSDPQKLEEYRTRTRSGWTEVARYLRSIDPYHHPITAHPGGPGARNMVDDPSLIDIDMLQPPHNDLHGIPEAVNQVIKSRAALPKMPTLIGEVSFESEHGRNFENVQRLAFWTSILNGSLGHTYGANGIWQVNTRTQPYGPSPHGMHYGFIPWDEAMKLPGSTQLSLGKRLLERYHWWKFEPQLEWIEPHWTQEDYFKPYAAGIPKETRFIYIPSPGTSLSKVKGIEPGVSYHAFYFDVRLGEEYDLGTVVPDEKCEWKPPHPPIIQDWVLVMEAKG